MFEYAIYLTVLALGLILANAVANKKVSIVSLVLALLSVAIYLTKHIEALATIYASIDASGTYLYYLVVASLAALLALISVVYYSIKRKTINKLFEVSATFDSNRVFAIVSKKGKLLKASSKLENIIEKMELNPNDYELSVVKFEADGQVYTKSLIHNLNNVLKDIIKSEDGYPISFTYSNGLNLELDVDIEEVLIKNKLYGYTLFDKNIVASDEYKTNVDKYSKKTTFMYLDMLDSDVAYYDNVVDKYILTNHMFASTGLAFKEDAINSISRKDFAKLIHPEDLAIYKESVPIPSKVLKIYYRVKLVADYDWFEESIFSENNKEFRILRKVDATVANKVSFGNYKQMIVDVEEMCKDNIDFGIIMLNLYSLPKITANIGKEMSDLVVSTYFTKVINGLLKDAVKVYKLSAIEYALVVNDVQLINAVKRDLYENNSFLTHQEITINKISETIECEIGLVDTTEVVNVNNRDMIKIAFDMLKQASDSAYAKNYCIYTKTAPVNLNYSLSDLGIDLDEDLSIYDEEDEKK